MGCQTAKDAVAKYTDILMSLSLNIPEAKEEDYNILTTINPVRL